MRKTDCYRLNLDQKRLSRLFGPPPGEIGSKSEDSVLDAGREFTVFCVTPPTVADVELCAADVCVDKLVEFDAGTAALACDVD